jgi:hypothetical protein
MADDMWLNPPTSLRRSLLTFTLDAQLRLGRPAEPLAGIHVFGSTRARRWCVVLTARLFADQREQ